MPTNMPMFDKCVFKLGTYPIGVFLPDVVQFSAYMEMVD